MRRVLAGLAVVAGFASWATPGHAQNTNAGFNDPFFFYYGFYLPRQQVLANQRGPESQVNTIAAVRQSNALAERAGLYDPIAPLGLRDIDPLRPFGPQSGRTQFNRIPPNGISNTNLTGAGHPLYFNRTGAFYPSLRTGRGYNPGFVSRSNIPNQAAAQVGSYMAIPGRR